MSQPDNPWGQPTPPKRPGRPLGLVLWLALLVAVVLGIVWLAGSWPDRLNATEDYARVVLGLAMVAFVSTGLIAGRRLDLGQTLRNVALWAAIVLVLAVGYTFREDTQRIGARVMAEFVPGYAAPSSATETVLSAGPGGHFRIIGTVNGTQITFLVDTGATDIVLSPADARRLGIDTRTLNYSRIYETANGIGRAAPTTLASLRIGPKTLTDQQAAINQAEMRESLLGMAFFRNSASFEVRGSTLFIRWH